MFNISNSNVSPDRHARASAAKLNSPDAPTPRFREYVRQLSGAQIEEHWRAHKRGFVAIASAPGHGLDATQLHTIWLLNWADRYAAATARGRAIFEKAVPACSREAFRRKIHSYHDDHFYEALGPAYHDAQTAASNASFMFTHCTNAHEILCSASAAGCEFILEQLDQAVVSATLGALA